MRFLKFSTLSLVIALTIGVLLSRSFVLSPSPLETSVELNTAAFLINMDRSTERLETITPLLSALPIKVFRISGVDGATLTDQKIQELVDLEKFKQYRGRAPKKGEIGCSLSHYKALKAFLQSDLSFALIIEDDAVFDPVVLTHLLQKAIEQRRHWDVLALQLNHRGLPLSVAPLDNTHRIVKYYGAIVESGAYVVNRKAAEAYINYFFPIILQYDYFYTREWEMGIKFRGVEPRPVSQADGYSFINASQNIGDNGAPMLGDVQEKRFSKRIFNLRTAITRFFNF